MRIISMIRRLFAPRAPTCTHDRQETRRIIAESQRLNSTARHVAHRAQTRRDPVTRTIFPEKRDQPRRAE